MNADTTLASPYRELAFRESDGIEVTLLWNTRDNRVIVSVSDGRTGECFEIDAPRDKALDVFHHPYSYAASHAAPGTNLLLAA